MRYKNWQTGGRRLFFVVFDAILATLERERTIIVLWMRRRDSKVFYESRRKSSESQTPGDG
jgi:hypothetical protein